MVSSSCSWSLELNLLSSGLRVHCGHWDAAIVDFVEVRPVHMTLIHCLHDTSPSPFYLVSVSVS